MAQTAAGGYSDGNDWVNGTLGITSSSSLSYIASVIDNNSNNSLESLSNASCYGTGYLACMYLGYLASGASTPTPTTGGGTVFGGINIQIGAESGQTMVINIDSSKASDLGIDTLSVLTQSGAQNSIDICTKAINKVSEIRSNLGAYQNRLEHAMTSIDNTEENMQNAESRIRDMDMAKGVMENSKYNVLIQTGQLILAQANQQSKNILALLG